MAGNLLVGMVRRRAGFTLGASCFCLGLLALGIAACGRSSNSDTSLADIKKRGVIKVGVGNDIPGFGWWNPATDQYEGLEIELAKQLAASLFGDPSKVELVMVTSGTRGALLNDGEVDAVISTFTITPERRHAFSFSPPYYTDSIGLLVKKEAGITSLNDLNGKIIGVLQYATTRSALHNSVMAANIKTEFLEFRSNQLIKKALNDGKVDAFCNDKSVLKEFLDSTTEVLTESFSSQSYGIAVKLGNKQLAAFVQQCINSWTADGTLTALIDRFGL